MADTFLSPTIISKMLAATIRNNLVAAAASYKEFRNEFVRVGNSITYRKPNVYVPLDGPDVTGAVKDILETSGTITINKHKTQPFDITAKDLTLNDSTVAEKFYKRHILPAGIGLANQIDSDLLDLYKEVYNYTGTAGTTPATAQAFNLPKQILDRFSTPPDNRVMIIDGDAEVQAGQVHKGLFLQPQVSSIIKEGSLGRLYGFDIAASQNIKTHTAGVPGGTPLVAGGSQSGATLNIDGMTTTTGTYKEGDIITIAGVNSVNRLSKSTTGKLQPFVITADATADGSGLAALAISPSISLSGDTQNVSAGPANNAAITLIASHQANLAFRKDTFALVTVPFVKPRSSVWWGTSDFDGISVTISGDWDGHKFVELVRADVQYGVKLIYPDFACRLLG